MDYGSSYDTALTGMMATYYFIAMIAGVIMIIANWKIFVKAGQPGWAAIVPIYNIIVLLRVVNRPYWWVILFLIPVVNIVIAFIVIFDLGKSFGKSGGWSFFLLLVLSVIGYLILGFGKDQYKKIERAAA